MTRQPSIVLMVLGVLVTPPIQALASEWYVGPNGSASNAGTAEAPWDIASALGGGRKSLVRGDTLWIQKGTYHCPPRNGGRGYEVRLEGAEGAPIQVRGAPGARVTIDGGLDLQAPSAHLILRDLEILVSEPRPSGPIPPDPSYANVNRPWGGLNVNEGAGFKFVNLVIHDNSQGVSWWTPSRDGELHGCLIFDNGWAGTDRGHGHAIYTQNAKGVKTISDCIMTGGFGYTLHAYGSSRADVSNYRVEGNIVYDAGTFLIGGGKPSHGIRVLENVLHGVPMQIGYTAPTNDDCEVRDNLIVNGGLQINNYKSVVNAGNLVLDAKSPRPEGVRIVLRRNKYDPDRAHVAVLNWANGPEVRVDPGTFLRPGDRYRFLNPRAVYGKPEASGTADGKTIPVPVKGEFAAFVLIREKRAEGPGSGR